MKDIGHSPVLLVLLTAASVLAAVWVSGRITPSHTPPAMAEPATQVSVINGGVYVVRGDTLCVYDWDLKAAFDKPQLKLLFRRDLRADFDTRPHVTDKTPNTRKVARLGG